jgi:hypothetical protein
MGFLDKLFGRKKDEADEGIQTAPEPSSMPAGETAEHPKDEGEQALEHAREEESAGPTP